VLESGLAGKGDQIKIPNTKDAFLCWGYMQAIQDLVVLTTPIIGSCPPEGTPTLPLLPPLCAPKPRRIEGQSGAGGSQGVARRIPVQSDKKP
jgi:hypothetical protein